MMRQAYRRLLALLLALCMTAALAPVALAAGTDAENQAALTDAAKAAGFDYPYTSTYTTMTASVAGGKASVTIPAPSGVIADRGVYAAVLPLDGGDDTVRFCRTEGKGPYTVSYAMSGCSQFAVMLVQPVIDGGTIAITTAASYDEAADSYQVTYTAALNMSEALAEIAAVNKDDEAMDDLRFTCYLTDPLVDSISTITAADITMDSVSSIFDTPTLTKDPQTGIWSAEFKLKANWEDGLTTETAKARLLATMSLTVKPQTVGYQDLQNKLVEDMLYTTGWLTITHKDGSSIPGLGGQKQITLPANLAELKLIEEPGSLIVTVEDGKGNPVPDALVTITLVSETETLTLSLRTDNNGQAAFDPLIRGTYKVDVSYTDTVSGRNDAYFATTTQPVYEQNVELTVNLKKTTSGGILNTEVTSDNDQPASAENLESAADRVDSGETVMVTLKVDTASTEGDEITHNQAQAIVEKYGTEEEIRGETVFTDFVDATLKKTTYKSGEDPKEEIITDTQSNLITIHIPLTEELVALAEKYGLSVQNTLVYRAHGEGDAMQLIQLNRVSETATSHRDGYYYIHTMRDGAVVNHYAVIYTSKFSVYAFALPIPDGSSGSSGGVTRYPVETESGGNGSVSASHDRAASGTKVTVTVTPDEGYRLNNLIVTDSAGNRITVTANADGTYTFTMPARGVTVEANFTRAIADPEDTGVSGWLETGDHIVYMIGDDHGDFRPDANITRAEVVQMFYRLLLDQDVPVTEHFDDVPADAWYAHPVEVLASLGIVKGVGNDKFAPDRAITRAEFAAIAARFAQAAATGASFTDVPETHWAYGEITTAASYGWVTGIGGGLFAPDRLITRGEAAAMVNRMLGRLADKAAIDAGQARPFPDVTDSHWAWYEIGEATTEHDYTMGSEMETWHTP